MMIVLILLLRWGRDVTILFILEIVWLVF